MKISFNIDNIVWVKLNDYGIKILKDRYEEAREYTTCTEEFEMPFTDREGYTKFYLHEIMQIFGVGIIPCRNKRGMICPFDSEILIKLKDL